MKEKKKKEGNLVGKVVPDNVKKFGWRLLFVNFFLCMQATRLPWFQSRLAFLPMMPSTQPDTEQFD